MIYTIRYPVEGSSAELSRTPIADLRAAYPELEAYDESGNSIVTDGDLLWALDGSDTYVRVWPLYCETVNDESGQNIVATITRN